MIKGIGPWHGEPGMALELEWEWRPLKAVFPLEAAVRKGEADPQTVRAVTRAQSPVTRNQCKGWALQGEI